MRNGCSRATLGVSAVLVITVLMNLWSGVLSAELPFQSPCLVDHTEIISPRTRPSAAWGRPSRSAAHLPGVLSVLVTWRGRHRRLTLFPSDVASRQMVTLYEDDARNDTVAEMGGSEGCLYQGYLKDDAESFAAVSTCQGLAGFIRTEDELLFIEPTPTAMKGGRLWERQPHRMYSCFEGRDVGTVNMTETRTPEPRHRGRRIRRKRRRQRRRAGSLSQRRYVEVQVVVDHTLLNMHGTKRIQQYVMTLMNIANSVYQHPSLGVNVRVVVTELILLQQHEQKEVIVRKDPFGTVKKFCAWSKARHPPSRAIRHDVALLLTRERLGPAGYAPITGMCDPNRSCATVSDEGFTSGFIIAHEMAHVMGLLHDGQGNSCSGPGYRTAIMAPLVEAKLNRFRWSECSRSRIQEVIKYLFCLDNKPDMDSGITDHYDVDSGYVLPDDIGRHWSLNFQCRMEFGHRWRLCPAFSSDACNVLWCGDNSSPYMCRTKRGPPMPGSNCGYNRECRDRRCVYVGREPPVHGQWSEWAAWGDCSVHCGIGIKRRRRFCSKPRPVYGGRDCPGEAEDWDTCVAKNCKSEYYDLRAVECGLWDDLNIREGRHDWRPYQTTKVRDRCKQTCISSKTREVVTITADVTDATPCDYDNPTNICYNGHCLSVGCDGVQNSNKTYDSCGVCGGDHSRCKTVSGHFVRKPLAEDKYEPVVFLPRGSRNVEVVKRGNTGHIIALKEAFTATYLVNGDKTRQTSHELVAAGARIVYDTKFAFQRFYSDGPLFANLQVMLYPGHDMNDSSVTYEYSVEEEDVTLEKHKYFWQRSEWSPCSVSCGEGMRTAEFTCVDNDTGEERDNTACRFVKAPAKLQEHCVLDPCSLTRHVWTLTEDWSTCNTTECGQEGVATQSYICQQHVPLNDSYSTVPMKLCDPHTAPYVTRNCSGPPCSLPWTVGNWSQCSVTCGKGEQTRTAHCGDPTTDQDDVLCKDSPPRLSTPCHRDPCPDEVAHTECQDKYHQCAESKDLGAKCHSERFRELCCKTCQRQRNAARSPPVAHRAIHKWVLTDQWSSCSARECEEEGEQTQGYSCQMYFSHNHTYLPVHASRCDPTAISVVSRKCTAPPCGLTWSTGSWSQCSVTCGEGRQSRSAHCGDPNTDSDDVFCKDTPPALSRLCDRGLCPGAKTKRVCMNKYYFCGRAMGLKLKCRSKRFRRICCKTCRRVRQAARKPGWKRKAKKHRGNKYLARKHGAKKHFTKKLANKKHTNKKSNANSSLGRSAESKSVATDSFVGETVARKTVARKSVTRKSVTRKFAASKSVADKSIAGKFVANKSEANIDVPSQWDLYRRRMRRRRY